MSLGICIQLSLVKDVMAPIWSIFRTKNDLIEEEEHKDVSIEERQIYKQNSLAYNLVS